MNMMWRTPHPVTDPQVADENGRRICAHRGYCGPFINQELYNSFLGWEGLGDCVECGATLNVAVEQQKQAASPEQQRSVRERRSA